jgi:hypothetical protein
LVPFLRRVERSQRPGGTRQLRGARDKEKRPEDRSSGLSSYEFLVRLAGIEPTTPWFVAKYSIQLSYSRERKAL